MVYDIVSNILYWNHSTCYKATMLASHIIKWSFVVLLFGSGGNKSKNVFDVLLVSVRCSSSKKSLRQELIFYTAPKFSPLFGGQFEWYCTLKKWLTRYWRCIEWHLMDQLGWWMILRYVARNTEYIPTSPRQIIEMSPYLYRRALY